MGGSGLRQKRFGKIFSRNIYSNKAINDNCQFSHETMETLRCHSNQSSHLIGTKNITCVEANVNIMYAKY